MVNIAGPILYKVLRLQKINRESNSYNKAEANKNNWLTILGGETKKQNSNLITSISLIMSSFLMKSSKN